MEQILKLAMGGLTLIILTVAITKEIFADSAINKLMEIQKEYSPSAYGPGFDPDKWEQLKFKKGG